VATSLCVLVALGWTALHASDYLLHGARPLDLQHGPEPVPRLDLNRASRTELQHLPGIGPVLAERIVEYRSARGPFRSVEDLLKVDGIGLAKLERIRSLVMVRGETAMRNAARSTDTNPTRPTIENPTETRPGAIPPPKPPGKKVLDLAGAKINVNQASALELQRLPGIGPKLSERIIAERAKARFRSVEELRRVPGIGPKTLEKLRPHVTVD
jgi:competence protein ComEA